jgi:internalin A
MQIHRLAFLLSACVGLCGAGSIDWISSLGGKSTADPAGNVTAVNLRGTWVTDVDLIELAKMPRLERLDLSHTRISDEGMLYLRPARKITDLNLYSAEQVTDQGMAAIKDWTQLRRLNVRGTRISDGTLAIVSHLPQLESLDVANTPVTENGLDYLMTLTSLKELSLGRRRLNDNTLEVLRLLGTLTYLDLGGPGTEDRPDMTLDRRSGEAGAMRESMVRAIAGLKNLRVLKLGHSNISTGGLAAFNALSSLEKLGLEGCRRIDDGAVAELAGWKNLKYVDLQDTAVTEKGLRTLRSHRPDLNVLANPGEAQQKAEDQKPQPRR